VTIHDLHEVNPFFQHAVAEHRELHHAFEKVREHLSSKDTSQGRLAEAIRLLTELRDRLSQHFSQEENGGYLEEAITRLPRLEPQAAVLQRQHGEFLDAANQLLRDARRPISLAELWNGLRDGYSRLMKRLEAHEAAENKLLQTAFNEDMGF
jgi:hemerythrin